MNKLLTGCLLSTLSLLGAETAVAAACSTFGSGNLQSDTSEVTITSAAVATISGDGTVIFTGSLSATDCAGWYSGNDMPLPDAGTYAPELTNIGRRYDGLLNGEYQTGGNSADELDGTIVPTDFTPGAFVGESDLIDQDGVDQGATFLTKDTPDGDLTDDPGWVYLGKDDANNEGFDFASGDLAPAGINLSLFMDIDFSCAGGGDLGGGCMSGDWSLTFLDPEGLLAALESTVFGDSFFDHLAIVLKAGSGANGDGGFVVYDFNFNTINDLLGGAFDLNIPHNFIGTWSTELLGKDISHVSVWARDPADPTDVPEPAPLLLIGLALFLLTQYRRKIARS